MILTYMVGIFESFITLLIHTHHGADFLVWQLNVLKCKSHNVNVLGSQLGDWLKPVTIIDLDWLIRKDIYTSIYINVWSRRFESSTVNMEDKYGTK